MLASRRATAAVLASLALSTVLLPHGARAEGGPAQPWQKVAQVEGISEYRLPNGLGVLLFPDATKETITVNVTYLVGSRHEGLGETGMAHLLEHMVFKGTDRHPNIPQELTAHGARPNGTTSFDRTNYYETFQATEQNLRWALDLESDRMVNSHVARRDLDTEMTVVRNEYESGENSPFGVLVKRLLAVAFDAHGYGHTAIGARADIENVPIERLQAFYRRYYQPDNAVLTISGRIDEARTLALVTETFGPLPRPQRTLYPTYTREQPQDGEREVTLRRVGDTQVVAVAFHIPSGVHPDAASLELLAYVLGNAPAGRLHKALVEPGLAASVSAFSWALAEPGLLMATAEVREGKPLAEVERVLLATLESLASAPVTAEEVERARAASLKQITLTMNQAEVLGLRLSDWIAKGDWRLFFLHRDQLRQVTAADVSRVAAAYLKPSNRTLARFIPTAAPDRATIPEAPAAASLVAGYKGDPPVSQGEAFDPSPANIEARTRRTAVGGVKLALLPKKTRGGTVSLSLVLHYGDLKALTHRGAVADLTTDMLMRGTLSHTRQQLADELDRLKARVSVGGETGAVRASIETVRESLPAALALVVEALRRPAFPADELEQLRQENLAGIESQRTQPDAIAGRVFEDHQTPYPPGDPRHTSQPDEELAEYQKVTLAEVKAFHQEFLGAEHIELAAVGDFDADALVKQVGSLLGGWTARRPYARIPWPYQEVEPLASRLITPDRANAVLLVGENLLLRDDAPDYPALVLGNFMLGGGFLNSRLAVRIRQREGLSYGVGSSLSARALDQNGSFSIHAIHAPQNTERLEVALREELDRALREGFTADEMAEASKGLLQTRQMARAQDGGLAGKLATYLFLNRTLQWDAAEESRLAKLTPAEVLAALRRTIDPARLTFVRAGDFAKGAAAPAATRPAPSAPAAP
jgi:zinc protease